MIVIDFEQELIPVEHKISVRKVFNGNWWHYGNSGRSWRERGGN